MADTDRTFSEAELTAIVADRVQRETADLTTKHDQLHTTVTDLQTKLDVETSAKAAAEQRASEAEKALADFKAEIEAEKAKAERKDERLKKVKEAAAHLGDDFFTEERVNRIVAMDDDLFSGYTADLAETAKGAPAKTTTTSAPRESAMQTTSDSKGGQSDALQTWFGKRGALTTAVKEG